MASELPCLWLLDSLFHKRIFFAEAVCTQYEVGLGGDGSTPATYLARCIKKKNSMALFIRDSGSQGDVAAPQLMQYFGTLTTAVLTLYQAVTAGVYSAGSYGSLGWQYKVVFFMFPSFTGSTWWMWCLLDSWNAPCCARRTPASSRC